MMFRTLLCLSAAVFALATQPARAEWPDKAVRIILPGPPGSSPDRVTRHLAERLSKQWKQPVVVENRPGGTTRIGAAMVASAAPDGYTLLSTFVSHGMAKMLYPDTTYDPITDFSTISKMVNTETVFVVPAGSPYKTFAELVEAVRKRGKPLQIGNFGNGSSFHFYSLILGKDAGIDVLPVPYKGEALSLADMLGGHVESSFNSVGTALPHIRAGKARALAMQSPTRSKVLPDVPTFGELGIARLKAGGWFGLLAPARTPPAIVDRINADVAALLREAETTQWLRDQGLEPVFETPAQFATALAGESEGWRQLIKEFKITVD